MIRVNRAIPKSSNGAWFRVSVSCDWYQDEEEFHTLNETTLIQSVCMDIDLIKKKKSDLQFIVMERGKKTIT